MFSPPSPMPIFRCAADCRRHVDASCFGIFAAAAPQPLMLFATPPPQMQLPLSFAAFECHAVFASDPSAAAATRAMLMLRSIRAPFPMPSRHAAPPPFCLQLFRCAAAAAYASFCCRHGHAAAALMPMPAPIAVRRHALPDAAITRFDFSPSMLPPPHAAAA
jgi:hypothetical protein